MTWTGTRKRLLALTGFGLAATTLGRLAPALAARPLVSGFRVDNGGRAFAGDSDVMTTLGAASGRTVVRLRFFLAHPSNVTLEVSQTGQGVASERPVAVGQTKLSARHASLRAGEHEVRWTVDPKLPARTYVLRLKVSPGVASPSRSRPSRASSASTRASRRGAPARATRRRSSSGPMP